MANLTESQMTMAKKLAHEWIREAGEAGVPKQKLWSRLSDQGYKVVGAQRLRIVVGSTTVVNGNYVLRHPEAKAEKPQESKTRRPRHKQGGEPNLLDMPHQERQRFSVLKFGEASDWTLKRDDMQDIVRRFGIYGDVAKTVGGLAMSTFSERTISSKTGTTLTLILADTEQMDMDVVILTTDPKCRLMHVVEPEARVLQVAQTISFEMNAGDLKAQFAVSNANTDRDLLFGLTLRFIVSQAQDQA